jgi:arabinogalactan oligomer / maltooligosaccharide transport system substrate-binding protein
MSSVPNSGTSPKPGNPDKSSEAGNAGTTSKPRVLDRQLGGKRIWDWFGALAVPVAVLAATIWFTGWQSHLTDLQHQDDTMETYISNMKDLLNQGLNAPQSQIAEEQTITTLRRLNVQHNQIILQFLQNAHLVGAQEAVIDLSNADLSYDKLSNTDLSHVDLTNANLSHVDLAGANLSGSTMYGADLTGADLNGATLAGASLSSAILTGADLSGADLSGADLPGAAITQSQVDAVAYCTDTILPNGKTCRNTCRYESLSTVPVCQQTSPIQLTYWYTESAAEAHEVTTLVNEFNQQHPDIHVNAMPMDFFHMLTAFPAALQDGSAVQEGNAPDVLRSDVNWTPMFASEGYLLNIESYVSQSDRSGYLSAALQYDKYKGDLYGLPQGIDFPELLYNKHELNQAGIPRAPVNMDEFEKDAVKIVQQNKAKYGFEFSGTSYDALPFLYAYGARMFDQHGNILVNNTGSIAGLNFLVNLQKVGKVQVMPRASCYSTPSGTAVSDFANGTTAMIFDGPHDINGLLTGEIPPVNRSVFKNHPGYLGIALLPTGPTGQSGSPLGGESYVISADTAHPAQAYEFIKFMSLKTSSQVAITRENHTLPTLKSLYPDLASNNPYSPVFISALKKATVIGLPPIPQTAYLFDAADPHIWDALTSRQTADEALRLIAYAWKQLGAGNRVSQPASVPGTSSAACQ